MAFGATEAAMNNGDSFENGKKNLKKSIFIKNDHISTKMALEWPDWPRKRRKWPFHDQKLHWKFRTKLWNWPFLTKMTPNDQHFWLKVTLRIFTPHSNTENKHFMIENFIWIISRSKKMPRKFSFLILKLSFFTENL